MNCGEVTSNRSTAALANGVSGMRTPASDFRRVIVAITELLIVFLMPSPLSADDCKSAPDTAAVRHRTVVKRLAAACPVRRIRSAEQSGHSLRQRPDIA